MNILFIAPSYKPAYIYGGTIIATAKLAEQLVRLGHNVSVYTTTANGENELEVDVGTEIVIEGVHVVYFRRLTKDHTHISPSLWRCLNGNVTKFDLVHIHSWWNVLVIVAAWICKRNGISPVLSPHGMFSDYILTKRNSKKKMLIHRIGGAKLLRNTMLHVSTEMELEEARRLIPKWQNTIIPNLVQLSDKAYLRRDNDIFTIGFLSRVVPKKGLDLLIKALSRVNFRYRLLIAGSGETDYVDSLVELSKECGNFENIEWVGWKDGEERFAFLSQIDLFALTSHSENFAIVVIEALSVGTPVLISDQVGLYEYILRTDSGWVCETDVERNAGKLNEIYADKEKREKINKVGADLVRKDYDDEYLAEQYVQFYDKILSDNKIHASGEPIC